MPNDLYNSEYPKEPIGGGNPYYKCSSCGASDPQINGMLEGHFDNCEWAYEKKKELAIKYFNEFKVE